MSDNGKKFKLADFRVSSEYDDIEAPLYETVTLGKPPKEVWFRTFMVGEAVDAFFIYEDRITRTVFVFLPGVEAEFADDLSCVRLTPYITRDLHVELWPIKQDKIGKAPNSWNASAFAVALEAESVWVRLRSIQSESVYRAYHAKVDFGEPNLPEESYKDLVMRAFGNNVVAGGDHPLVKKLMGVI